MICLSCGRLSDPADDARCSCCDPEPPSVLRPLDPLTRLIADTSDADFALFVIALNRRERSQRDAS